MERKQMSFGRPANTVLSFSAKPPGGSFQATMLATTMSELTLLRTSHYQIEVHFLWTTRVSLRSGPQQMYFY